MVYWTLFTIVCQCTFTRASWRLKIATLYSPFTDGQGIIKVNALKKGHTLRSPNICSLVLTNKYYLYCLGSKYSRISRLNVWRIIRTY